jgi:hypothetical protein
MPAPSVSWRRLSVRLELERLEQRRLLSAYYVAPGGADTGPGTLAQPFATIQHALDQATEPGDIVYVRGGTYNQQVQFNYSGAAGAPITLEAYGNEQPVLDGTGLPQDGDMVLMQHVSYVSLIGFEIDNYSVGNRNRDDGSGVRIDGSGTDIQVLDNTIHGIDGLNAMGITVYGTSVKSPLSYVTISGNTLYNLQSAPSEALTLDGNVNHFTITNNVVHDVNNIGIDMIGGEKDINPIYVARNGEVSGNVCYNCNSDYGGGFADGIYVDGGKNITIERNTSYQNDQGIEVGAENAGIVATGVIVRDNLIYNNDKAALVFGGYKHSVGRVNGCDFVNNTIYDNDTLEGGWGQIEINFGSHNVLTNNIIWASADDVMLDFEGGANTNVIDHNLWYTADGSTAAVFVWHGNDYDGFAAYSAATHMDADSVFADPQFVSAAKTDFHLAQGSPALGAGSNVTGQFAPTDFDGVAVSSGGLPAIGAFEV